MTAPHERYRRYLEALTPQSLDDLSHYVSASVRFRDPFHDVRNRDGMARVFRRMFETVRDIRFAVQHMAMDGDVCLMQWRFSGLLRGRAWQINGASAVRFDPDGQVVEHIDYWDAAENLYERLPLIGWLLSRLRRRLTRC